MSGRGCPHRAEWTTRAGGEWRCNRCGTRRFLDYGALRPPGLPSAVTPVRRGPGEVEWAAALRWANRGARAARSCPGAG
ncbi:DUF6255 family natural product biosynthesis protein [Streptomyces cinnamoneus]|uniref:DUF6255 family natural product biosynthesis protein n=1 Tax=Streptomyces cinnamoneus TaxID=53446 RepID=UPI003792A8AB